MSLSQKISLYILTMLLLCGKLHSQVWVLSSVTGQTIDTVTVGSREGYAINYDSFIKSLPGFDPSVFNWKLSNDSLIRNLQGTALTPSSDGFYDDTIVSVIMPPNKGLISLSVHEKSMIKGFGCTDPIGKILKIRVLPRPSIQILSNIVGGYDLSDITIPVKVTGFGPWKVSYSIISSDGTSSIHTISLGTKDDMPSMSQLDMVITIPYSEISTVTDSYTIKIVNIVDRIALKSLDQSLVASQPDDIKSASGENSTGISGEKIPLSPKPKMYHLRNK